jgi:hypothetical protein
MPKQFADGSWGVRVNEYRPQKKNPTSLDKSVGDRHFGYRVRPQRDGVVLVDGADGSPIFKSARKTACRKRKMPSRLCSRVDSAVVDEAVKKEQEMEVLVGKQIRRDMFPRFRARKGQKPASQQHFKNHTSD